MPKRDVQKSSEYYPTKVFTTITDFIVIAKPITCYRAERRLKK